MSRVAVLLACAVLACGHRQQTEARPDAAAVDSSVAADIPVPEVPTDASGPPADRPSDAVNGPAWLLKEFDGRGDPGEWQPHGSFRSFVYKATPAALEIEDAGGQNQHLTRAGLLLDPRRPYEVAVSFRISPDRTVTTPGLNSFCMNFNVQGAGGRDDDLAGLYTHAINLDVADGGELRATIKYMGFVNGGFASIGGRQTSCCRSGRDYRMRVQVNRDATGATKLGTIVVTLSEGATTHETFTVDYASFPWQPDRSRSVRLGFNTHGADWRLWDLDVRYLD